MAQRSHVPKFGNWDRENVPYTAYFDNARKEKGTGMKKMNPNDPEENPDAFTSGMMGYEIEDSHHARRGLPSQFTSDKKMPKHNEDLLNGEEGVIQKINFTQERSRNRKSSKSGSSSDISSSDRSLLQANQHRVRSSQKKNLGEGANNFQTPSPPAQVKTGNQQADEIKTRCY